VVGYLRPVPPLLPLVLQPGSVTWPRSTGERGTAGPAHDLPRPGYGTPATWVTGDEVYSADRGLGPDLERRQIGYVLAVTGSHQVTTGAGRLPGPPDRQPP
jgi:hypothetical protein